MKEDIKKKDQHSSSGESIELRRENRNDIIGEIPSSLVRWGLAAIIGIFVAVVASLCLIEYPYSNGESILEHLIG